MADAEARVRFTADTAGVEAGAQRAANAVGGAKDHIDAIGKSAQGARGNIANLASQFNDIGVQLSSGTSPFIVAIQQGTQISQVMAMSGMSVKSFGAALMSVVSPVSLLTIGIIAFGGAALQALGSLIPRTETATQAIQRHRDAVDKIVAGYGDAEKAVKDYFDALDKPSLGLSLAALSKQFEAIRAESTAAQSQIASIDDYLKVMADDGEAGAQQVRDLIAQFQSGEISANGLREAMQQVRLDSSVSSEVYSLAGSLDEAAQKAWNVYDAIIAVEHAASAMATDGALQKALDSKLAGQLSADKFNVAMSAIGANTPAQMGEIAAKQKEIELRQNQGITESLRQQEIEQARLLATKQAEYDQRQKGVKLYDQEAAKAQAVITSLQQQYAQLSMTDREKAIAVELANAHVVATSKEGIAIASLAGKIYDQRAAFEALKTSMRQINQLATTVFSSLINGFDKAISGMVQGTMNFQQAVGSVLNGLWQTFVQIVEQMAVKWLAMEAAKLFAHTAGNQAMAASDELYSQQGIASMIANAVKSILTSSKDAAAGTIANLSPSIGPAAIPVGLSVGAAVAGLASFDVGAWSVSHDQVATVHKGEMIVPSKGGMADAARNMMANGGGMPSAGEIAGALAAQLAPMFRQQGVSSAKVSRSIDEMTRRMGAR